MASSGRRPARPTVRGPHLRTVTGRLPGNVEPVEAECENCARPDDDLVRVHRLYVIPEDWDTAGSVTRVDETELWCFSCRSLYPHELEAP